MTEKRPLVWLSADSFDKELTSIMSEDWQLLRFCFESPLPVLVPPENQIRVGVLDLTRLPSETAPWLNLWLEKLAPEYWIGLAPHRPMSGTLIADLVTRYCADFHTLPIDSSRLSMALGHLWGMAEMDQTFSTQRSDNYQSLVLQGSSAAIRQTRELLRRYAVTSEPVLIVGESGTGREAAARFIHDHSRRAAGPYVSVNCAALPTALTQSELFGYAKGSFTHALRGHAGRLEQADKGTVVLMSIDELHLEQQSTMLRFLQDGSIERIGGHQVICINSRLIATTGQRLQDLVDRGDFRGDVFYRLGGLEVRLPALRDRQEDIPELARSLLRNFQTGGEQRQLSEQALHHLLKHSWPGNIRELQNRLRQALLLSDGKLIEPKDLGFRTPAQEIDTPDELTLEQFRARADRQALSCSLALTNHNVSAAARLLNISRVSFYRLMEKNNAIDLSPHNRQEGDAP